MKKSGDPVFESAKKFRDDISEAEVIAYLRARPDFLAHHADVVSGMVAPERWSGDGVVDMQKFLIDRRSGERDQLRDAAQDVIETSRSNMSVQTRTHAAVLSLLATRTWEDIFGFKFKIYTAWYKDFMVTLVRCTINEFSTIVT